MNYHDLRFSFSNSAAIKLLRSDNAAMVITFLHKWFKKENCVSRTYGELSEGLSRFLEELSILENDSPYVDSPDYYLNKWCDEEHLYLRKYYEENSDEPLFELTPETEKVFTWLMELEKREFVGTESRFLRIFELLREIVRMSNEDPNERLRILREERKEIDKQIEKIKRTGVVEMFNSTQVKERFYEATDTAYRLISDFREVEQNFKEFSRDIQKKRVTENITRGKLLEYILDTDDAIKESDQGRSFYNFFNFLNSPVSQEELENLTKTLFQLSEINEIPHRNKLLSSLKYHLIEGGEKIVSSNHKLAEQLRRLLDDRVLQEHKRTAELLSRIKECAFSLIESPPKERDFFNVDAGISFYTAMERPLWKKTTEADLRGEKPEEGERATFSEMSQLFSAFNVNKEKLKNNVKTMLELFESVTLKAVLEKYPVSDGLSEVMGYFDIASTSTLHTIDEKGEEQVVVGKKQLSVPLLTF